MPVKKSRPRKANTINEVHGIARTRGMQSGQKIKAVNITFAEDAYKKFLIEGNVTALEEAAGAELKELLAMTSSQLRKLLPGAPVQVRDRLVSMKR